MNNYAITKDVGSSAPNWSGFGLTNTRSQLRTPTPQTRTSPTQRTHTQFAILKGNVANFFERPTGTATAVRAAELGDVVATLPIANEPARTLPAEAAEARDPMRSKVERIASERMVLLARKYAKQHAPEILARLEKLNVLLMEIAPRVSDEQIVALENSHKLLQRTDEARAQRAQRRAVQAQT
ncbi:hypothetical protein [Caballeronia sp. M23-90]